jgi:monofunctional biosynthetic peptidoglycan transglycosylase
MRRLKKLLKGTLAVTVYPAARILVFMWRKKILQRAAAIVIIVMAVDVASYFFSPDVAKLEKQNPRLTEMMVHMERRGHRGWEDIEIRQVWVPLQRISPHLVKAVLIAEDDKFWRHEGFDLAAIKTAIEKDLKAKRFKFGGSTITQQLAKNLYLSPSKNPLRKLREAVLTWRMERVLTKARILEIYLNVAEWGESVYGIEAASRHYYGKSAHELGPQEAVRLAVVLPNPKRYNPTGPSRYISNRAEIIHKEMVRRGMAADGEH